MRNLIATLSVLVMGCLIAPIVEPIRVLNFGQLDVISGSVCVFSVDAFWTCMSRRTHPSSWRLLIKIIVASTAFILLWTPYTSEAAFDIIWLASIASALFYAIWERRNVFHPGGFE